MAVATGTTALGSSYDTLSGIVNGWFYDGCPSCSFGNPLQRTGWGGTPIPFRNISITAADMNSIVDRCNLGGDIVNSFGVSISQIVPGSKILASQYNEMLTAAWDIVPFINNIEAAELSIVSGVQNSRTSGWGSPGTIDNIIRFTFSNFNDSRYFWNSGGALSISMGAAGGSTSNYTNFVTLFSTMGTITFDYQSTAQSGSGGSVSSGIGFYDLTTSWQQIFQQDIGPYGYAYTAEQQITIYARRSASGNHIEIRTLLEDFDIGSVDGVITGTYNYRKLDNQTSGSASLSITAPVASVQNTFE
jgi:hypothetical protein